MVHLGVSCRAGPRFLSDFSENRAVRPSTCSKKGLTKKITDKLTDKSGQISSSAGTRFWTAKCQIPVAKPLKSSPQNEQPISLKKSTNGHLRLVRSLALSSSCACGAKKKDIPFGFPRLQALGKGMIRQNQLSL